MRRKDVEEFPFNDLAGSVPSQSDDTGPDFRSKTLPKMPPVTKADMYVSLSENQTQHAENVQMQNGYFVYSQQRRSVSDEDNPLIRAAQETGSPTIYRQSVAPQKRKTDAYEFLSENTSRHEQGNEQMPAKKRSLDRQIQILSCIAVALLLCFTMLIYLVFH